MSSRRAELTFTQLNLFANRLAHRLFASGGSRGDRVVLLMNQDLASFAAMLGVLKAGRVVVIFNPADPPVRLQELTADAEPAAILADSAHRDVAVSIACDRAAVICVEDDLSAVPAETPEDAAAPDDLAMLIYTSGTTGRPKGVMLSHGQLMSGLSVDVRQMQITCEDRIILVASLWGGQGNFTAWAALFSGARLVSHPANIHGVTGIAERMIDDRITIFGSAASLFRHFMKSIDDSVVFPDVRYLRVSSDPATSDDFRAFCRHFPNAKFVSAAGLSEVGFLGWLTFSRNDKVVDGRLPIGRPPGNTTFRIVDEAGGDVPAGAIGRIVLSGRYMALGYWRDPALTARHFSVEPSGMRVFRSADLGWTDEQGRIFLAGRQDATYKISGQRVDLSEVQRALSEMAGVAAAAVTALERPNGEPQLIAYIVPTADQALTARRLRALARGVMPRHFVPSLFVFLDEMPRAANGKPDLSRLRSLAPPPRERSAAPPVGDTETRLAGIWAEAFGQDGIGRSDDFFDLGGDSLIAAVVAARVHAAFGVELNFGTFVDHPLLSIMAVFIDQMRSATGSNEEFPLVAADRSRPLPLSPLQSRLWKPDDAPHNASRLTRATAERIEGRLDVALFRESVAAVIARHEILRTRFPALDGEPVQVVEAPRRLELPLLDWSSFGDAEERITAFLESEGCRVFDVTLAPPIALSLIKTAAQVHWLIVSFHHIIADAQSADIFVQDIAAAYAARVAGDRSALPPLAIQFGDFAVWQRRMWSKDSPRFRSVIAWWQEQFRAGLAPTRFPYRSKPPRKPLRPSDWYIRWGLAPSSSQRLDELGQRESATFYMVRLAGLLPVLAALTGRDDAVVGGLFTTRNRLAHESMYGCFHNLVTIALRCDRRMSFRDFIGRVRDHLAALQANAEIPYDQLAEEMAALDIKVPPLPVVMDVRTPHPPVRVAGLQFTRRTATSHMPRGVGVGFNPFAEADNGYMMFDARLYDKETLERFLSSLVRFFEAASADAQLPIGELIARADIQPF